MKKIAIFCASFIAFTLLATDLQNEKHNPITQCEFSTLLGIEDRKENIFYGNPPILLTYESDKTIAARVIISSASGPRHNDLTFSYNTFLFKNQSLTDKIHLPRIPGLQLYNYVRCNIVPDDVRLDESNELYYCLPYNFTQIPLNAATIVNEDDKGSYTTSSFKDYNVPISCTYGKEFAKLHSGSLTGSKKEQSIDFELVDDYRDISYFTTTFVTAQELSSANETLRKALLDYALAGGIIVIEGEGKVDGFPEGKHCLGSILYCNKFDFDFFVNSLDLGKNNDDNTFESYVAKVARQASLQNIGGLKGTNTFALAVDNAVSEHILKLQNKFPFATLISILATFVILVGPILIKLLSKKNKRIHILWIFPIISIFFSILVALFIVCTNGINPKLWQYTTTIEDKDLGMAVTIENDLFFAPFGISDEISYPRSATISYNAITSGICGKEVLFSSDKTTFKGDWVMSNWPVCFRTLRIHKIGEESPLKPISSTMATTEIIRINEKGDK